MIKNVLSCFFISIFAFPKSSEAEPKKIVTYHAPQSFYDVLTKLDGEGEILTANEQWFQPSLASVWVVFLSSKADRVMLPEFLLAVIDLADEQKSSKFPIQRYKYTLADSPEQTVQIMDLSKAALSSDFFGCMAAFEIHNYLKGHTQVFEQTTQDCKDLGY